MKAEIYFLDKNYGVWNYSRNTEAFDFKSILRESNALSAHLDSGMMIFLKTGRKEINITEWVKANAQHRH